MSVKSYYKQAYLNKTEASNDTVKSSVAAGRLKNYLSTQNSFHSKTDKINASVDIDKCRSRI